MSVYAYRKLYPRPAYVYKIPFTLFLLFLSSAHSFVRSFVYLLFSTVFLFLFRRTPQYLSYEYFVSQNSLTQLKNKN